MLEVEKEGLSGALGGQRHARKVFSDAPWQRGDGGRSEEGVRLVRGVAAARRRSWRGPEGAALRRR
jgi:hypothetical protein